MKTYEVEIPFTVIAIVRVQAEDENAAIEAAEPDVGMDSQGSVCCWNGTLANTWPDSAQWDKAEAREAGEGSA